MMTKIPSALPSSAPDPRTSLQTPKQIPTPNLPQHLTHTPKPSYVSLKVFQYENLAPDQEPSKAAMEAWVRAATVQIPSGARMAFQLLHREVAMSDLRMRQPLAVLPEQATGPRNMVLQTATVRIDTEQGQQEHNRTVEPQDRGVTAV